MQVKQEKSHVTDNKIIHHIITPRMILSFHLIDWVITKVSYACNTTTEVTLYSTVRATQPTPNVTKSVPFAKYGIVTMYTVTLINKYHKRLCCFKSLHFSLCDSDCTHRLAIRKKYMTSGTTHTASTRFAYITNGIIVTTSTVTTYFGLQKPSRTSRTR